MTGEIVPFGKYKGQPVQALAADEDYCEWLTAQPWFRQRYGNVYNILIQGGTEPQDSPEHNQMQATFLDDARCFALADLLYPDLRAKYDVKAAYQLAKADPFCSKFRDSLVLEASDPGIRNRTFEDRGWDVVYAIWPAAVRARLTDFVPPLQACICECDHGGCLETSRCRGGARRMGCEHVGHSSRGAMAYYHCSTACFWKSEASLTHQERVWLDQPPRFAGNHHGSVRAELKPDLGDDYPAVLRQVTGYPREYGDRRCVIARRYAFEHVTWDQVRQIFAASRITLLAEGEITS